MRFSAFILLSIFLLLQAGPAQAAQAALADACGQQQAEPCTMACCEPASCACLEEQENHRPPAPLAPAPERSSLPAFVWVLTGGFSLPSSHELLADGCRSARSPAPCRTEAVSLSVRYCTFLT
jgi:hypothetical protein